MFIIIIEISLIHFEFYGYCVVYLDFINIQTF